jgi:hypothetical protein
MSLTRRSPIATRTQTNEESKHGTCNDHDVPDRANGGVSLTRMAASTCTDGKCTSTKRLRKMADSASDCNVAGNQLPPFDSHEPLRWPDGDPVDAIIAAALDRLDARRQRVRGVGGRWAVGNGGRLVTGERSDAFWASLEDARATIVEKVRLQLALNGDNAPETAVALVGAYAEAQLIRRSEFLQLTRLSNVPTTSKQERQQHDRRRRHLTAWAVAFDRELRAATLLGFARRSRQFSSMAQAIEAHVATATSQTQAPEPLTASRHDGVAGDPSDRPDPTDSTSTLTDRQEG